MPCTTDVHIRVYKQTMPNALYLSGLHESLRRDKIVHSSLLVAMFSGMCQAAAMFLELKKI